MVLEVFISIQVLALTVLRYMVYMCVKLSCGFELLFVRPLFGARLQFESACEF